MELFPNHFTRLRPHSRIDHNHYLDTPNALEMLLLQQEYNYATLQGTKNTFFKHFYTNASKIFNINLVTAPSLTCLLDNSETFLILHSAIRLVKRSDRSHCGTGRRVLDPCTIWIYRSVILQLHTRANSSKTARSKL